MNIPDIKAYIQALKLTWIKRIFDENSKKWKILLKKTIPEIENLNKYGAGLLERKNINPFWNDVFNVKSPIYILPFVKLVSKPK